MEKVISWELYKKLKFDHTNKWYTYNLESMLENKTHTILWDFEKQMDHLISARQPASRPNNSQKKKKEKKKKRA